MLLITLLQSRAFRSTLDEEAQILLQLAQQWGHGNRRRFRAPAQCRGAVNPPVKHGFGSVQGPGKVVPGRGSPSPGHDAAGEGRVLPHLAVPQEMCPACAGRALLHLLALYQKYHWQAGIVSTREKRAEMKGFLSAALQWRVVPFVAP